MNRRLEVGVFAVAGIAAIAGISAAAYSFIDDGAPPSRRALKSALTGVADESARIAYKFLDAAPSWFRARFDFRPQLSLPVGSDSLVFWFKLTEQSGDAYPGQMSNQVGNDDRRFPARALGEIVIVEVGAKVSIGVVTLSVQEMSVGDLVMMQRPR